LLPALFALLYKLCFGLIVMCLFEKSKNKQKNKNFFLYYCIS